MHLLARYHPQILLFPVVPDVVAGVAAIVVGVVIVVRAEGAADTTVTPPVSATVCR